MNEDQNPFAKNHAPLNLGDSKVREEDRGSILCWPSNKFINPVNPRVDDIEIEDIAHSLSILCRFTGHIPAFYSIAQHSLIVSSMVPQTHRLAALMHDAEEAYIGDWSSPLKYSLRAMFPGFDQVEKRLRMTIFERFGIDYRLYDEVVKDADDAVYRMERSAFWRNTGAISFMEPMTAEKLFLSQFHTLRGAV